MHCVIAPEMRIVSLLCFCAATSAFAGPNAGGTLIVSAQEGITYCHDSPQYCSAFSLAGCESADTQLTAGRTYVFYVAAAFPCDQSRMSSVSFAVSIPGDKVAIVDQHSCADQETAAENWPYTGTGTSLTWVNPQRAKLVPVYWFAAYNYVYPDPATFTVVPHPAEGGVFRDDSVPPIVDPIAGYGSLGFGTPGQAPCPEAVLGACCFGACEIKTCEDCDAVGGTFLGAVPCDPYPCANAGACCDLLSGSCEIVAEGACALGGTRYVYQGDGVICDPSPCGPPRGACCLQPGGCEQVSEAECDAAGGLFLGIGVDCDACATGVNEASESFDMKLRAFPNPASGATTISFSLAEAAWTSAVIFDAAGQLVRALGAGQMRAGGNSLLWDGRDDAGRDVTSGVYFARVTTRQGMKASPVVMAR